MNKTLSEYKKSRIASSAAKVHRGKPRWKKGPPPESGLYWVRLGHFGQCISRYDKIMKYYDLRDFYIPIDEESPAGKDLKYYTEKIPVPLG